MGGVRNIEFEHRGRIERDHLHPPDHGLGKRRINDGYAKAASNELTNVWSCRCFEYDGWTQTLGLEEGIDTSACQTGRPERDEWFARKILRRDCFP